MEDIMELCREEGLKTFKKQTMDTKTWTLLYGLEKFLLVVG